MFDTERTAGADGGSAAAKLGEIVCGGGGMGEVVRWFPWERTSLGPIKGWPKTLVAMVNLALNSNVPSAVYWGPEMVMIYNDGYRDNLADLHPKALGESARVVWEDLWPRFGGLLEAGLADGLSSTEEKVALSVMMGGKTYETFWNFSISPIYEDGRVVGLFKTDQNVTEEVNAMSALAQSDERLRLALAVANCLGTWDWHIQADTVFVEERFAAVYGIDPRDSRKGLPRADFARNIHLDDRARVSGGVAEAMRTGKTYRMEYRIYQPDGSVRWVSSTGCCIYGEDGQPQRFPGITFDITAQKQAEEQAELEEPPAITLTLDEEATDEPGLGVVAQAMEPMVSLMGEAGSVPGLVRTIVTRLVERRDAISVKPVTDANGTRIVVEVAPEDVARLVGEKGATAKALRTLLMAAGAKRGHRFTLEIVDEQPGEYGVKGRLVH